MSDWQEGIKIGERLGRMSVAREAAIELEHRIDTLSGIPDKEERQRAEAIEDIGNRAHDIVKMLGVSYE
jgi:hypothetical protein